MSDPKNFPSEMQKRFYSLPPFIQETIMQSGVQLNSVDDLDKLAQDIEAAQKKES